MFRISTLMAILVLVPMAQAKVFRNAYVSFEMPDQWNCELEHTEWVCRSSIEKESKEAIMILTAKEVGPTDTVAAYTTHLNTPQTNLGRPSSVIYAPKQVKVNDHQWIDGLHLNSEVNNYYTRYLATIKDRIAILVTLSAHKDAYKNYGEQFFKSVQSLRVIATNQLLSNPALNAIRPGSGESIGAPISAAMPGDLMTAEAGAAEGKSGGSQTKSLLLGAALILAALGVYVFLKMRR